MAESISTLMKESSPSAERLELSAEGVWEMTRWLSLFFLPSDSSFLFCWTNAGKEFLQVHQSSFGESRDICVQRDHVSHASTTMGQIGLKPGKALSPPGRHLMISLPPLDGPGPQRRKNVSLRYLLFRF